jgi:hypothetical protein
MLKIKKSRSTSFHPETNGQIENWHRSLKSFLKTAIQSYADNWEEVIPMFMMSYRSAVHSSTKFSPHYLLFGREMKLPLDLTLKINQDKEYKPTEYVASLRKQLEVAHEEARKNNLAAQRYQKEYFDRKLRVWVFKPGDKVLIFSPSLKSGETPKLHLSWSEPYTIIQQISDTNYLVERMIKNRKRRKIVHINNLRAFYERPHHAGNQHSSVVNRPAQRFQKDVVKSHASQDSQDSSSDDSDDLIDPWPSVPVFRAPLAPVEPQPHFRRGERMRMPPDRFGFGQRRFL